eukprot:16441314-Heterocapsa_arctica.AAC.1
MGYVPHKHRQLHVLELASHWVRLGIIGKYEQHWLEHLTLDTTIKATTDIHIGSPCRSPASFPKYRPDWLWHPLP